MATHLINNDNMAPEVLEFLEEHFGVDKADIVFTSPPYNLGKGSNYFKKWYNENTTNSGKKYMEVDADNREDYVEWIVSIVKQYLKYAQYFFLNVQSLSSNKKDLIDIKYHLRDYFADEIIWDKKNGTPHGRNSRVMTATYEYILIFKQPVKGVANKRVGTREWSGSVKNLFSLSGNQGNKYAKDHKAMFPEQLVDYILNTYVKPNGVVIDPFGGLGTTAVVADRNNFGVVSIELIKEYHDKAVKRVLESREENKNEVTE